METRAEVGMGKKGTSDSLKKVQCSAQDHPFDAIFVAFSQCLPHGLFFRCFASYTDSRASAIGTGRVLLDLAKFDTLGRNVVPRVREVEHAPERCIRVWFGDLEERKVG